MINLLRRQRRCWRQGAVNYMTPLGLGAMTGRDHYGPGPWMPRPGEAHAPAYFHLVDSTGLGFDRTRHGSDAVSQYFPPLREELADPESTPERFLLWFHHVGWTDRLQSGRTLWDELVAHYDAGIDTVRSMQRAWAGLARSVDSVRFANVSSFLRIQEREAVWWRDASLSYWQTFSHLAIPSPDAQPAHPLSFYRGLLCPAGPTKPRCPEIYK